MSRKFLDDQIEIKGKASALPQNSKSYDPGHGYQDQVVGTIYNNEGSRQGGAIFGHPVVNRVDLIDDFLQLPLISTTHTTASDLNFITVGTNAADAGTSFSTGGGFKYATAGASADQKILRPSTAAKQTSWAGTTWNTSHRPIFETVIASDATITAQIVWAGLKLTNTPTAATDANQVYFRYQDTVNGGRFECHTSNGGTLTTIDSQVTVVASTRYHLKIVVDATFVPRFYINGVLVATGPAMLAATSLIPFIGIQATAAAASNLEVRVIRCSKDQID